MEIGHLNGRRAWGTQLGVRYELHYELEPGLLRLEVVAERKAVVELDGADYFDLAFSPLFNSLPVDDGLEAARDFTMRFVDVPSLEVTLSLQRYEPLGDGRVRFRSGDFEAEIAFAADGLVDRYEGLAERVA
jgi:uncharacterized protein